MSIETDIKPEDDLIPVDAPLEPEDDAAPEADSGEEDDSEDARLAQTEEDGEEDVTGSRKRRLARRDSRNRARERTERELAMLREQNAQLIQRMSAVETHAVSGNEQALRAQLDAKAREIEMAEAIIARATEAGNGDDVVAAMKLRDAATHDANRLWNETQQYEQRRATPGPDPRVANYANEWMAANPWYDPSGRDQDSAETKAIDSQLAQEGFDPKTRAYWEELSARVGDAFSAAEAPKKRAPPVGTTREHAPPSTRREIYVTPERKQAMIEAGAWDDPAARQRMLKAYRDYDHQSAR